MRRQTHLHSAHQATPPGSEPCPLEGRADFSPFHKATDLARGSFVLKGDLGARERSCQPLLRCISQVAPLHCLRISSVELRRYIFVYL